MLCRISVLMKIICVIEFIGACIILKKGEINALSLAYVFIKRGAEEGGGAGRGSGGVCICVTMDTRGGDGESMTGAPCEIRDLSDTAFVARHNVEPTREPNTVTLIPADQSDCYATFAVTKAYYRS